MGLVGVAVTVLLVTVYGNAFTEAKPSARQLEGFSLEEVLSGKFYAESFNGTWISGFTKYIPHFGNNGFQRHFLSADNEFSYKSAQGGINIYDVKTSTVSTIVKPEVVVSSLVMR